MEFFNTIRCPVTSDLVSRFSDTIENRNITPLKQFKDGVVAYAYLRGDNLVGVSSAYPTSSGAMISLWTDPGTIPNEKRGEFMKDILVDISHSKKVGKEYLYITDMDPQLREAIERTDVFNIKDRDDGSFYAYNKSYDESAECAGDCMEGYDEGIDLTWNPYTVSPKGPEKLICVMKEYILKHENDFDIIFKNAGNDKYARVNLNYDLRKILDSYNTYFTDLTVYITSLLRPADVGKNLDEGVKVLKSLDIDANFRENIFTENTIADRVITIPDGAEQLYAFVEFVEFLEKVKLAFKNLPHLDTKTADNIAPLINVYGYSVTEFMKRFCKELLIAFKNIDKAIVSKGVTPTTSEKFMLI